MREREIKFHVPQGFSLNEVELGRKLRMVPEGHARFETVYVDTPDLRLAGWGLSLRHRSGEGWTLKLPPSESGALVEREEIEFAGASAAGGPPAEARRLAAAFVPRKKCELAQRQPDQPSTHVTNDVAYVPKCDETARGHRRLRPNRRRPSVGRKPADEREMGELRAGLSCAYGASDRLENRNLAEAVAEDRGASLPAVVPSGARAISLRTRRVQDRLGARRSV